MVCRFAPEKPGWQRSLIRYIPAPLGCRIPGCQGATLVIGHQEFVRRVRGESRPCLAEGRRLNCRFQGVFDSFIGPEMTRQDCLR